MPRVEAGFLDRDGSAATDYLTVLGPSVAVHVGFDPAFTPGAGNPNIENFPVVPALVDTGAAESCIDSDLASELDLVVVERQEIAGAGGRHTADVHLAQMHIPVLELTIYGKFAGVHLAQGGQSHQVLLGRTFLRSCMMIYDGPTGRVSILL